MLKDNFESNVIFLRRVNLNKGLFLHKNKNKQKKKVIKKKKTDKKYLNITRAKVSHANFLLVQKCLFVQKCFRTKVMLHAVLSTCAILSAHVYLTTTPI